MINQTTTSTAAEVTVTGSDWSVAAQFPDDISWSEASTTTKKEPESVWVLEYYDEQTATWLAENGHYSTFEEAKESASYANERKSIVRIIEEWRTYARRVDTILVPKLVVDSFAVPVKDWK